MGETDFLDEPPLSDQITSYDERNLVVYLDLLDADAEGADWREAARLILAIDADVQPERAQKVHASHLARAQWMMDTGYLKLAARGHEKPKIR